MVPIVFHSLFGFDSILPRVHLDKGMPLLLVHDAGLNLAELAEDGANLTLGNSNAAYEQCTTKHLDAALG